MYLTSGRLNDLWYTNTSFVSLPHATRSPATLSPTKFFSLTCPSSVFGRDGVAAFRAVSMTLPRTSHTHMVLSVDADATSSPVGRNRT